MYRPLHWARSRPGALAALVLAAALICGSAVGWWSSRPTPNQGSAAVDALASSAGASSQVPVLPGALPSSGPTVTPVRLSIKAIGVEAAVIATGIDDRGDFAVPPSVDEVGWYRYGPDLASTSGSIVIGGHVDNRTQGPGAFFHLRDLSAGQLIEVQGSDGVTRQFQVVAREEYPKQQIDLQKYFAATGSLRLTLITCGGPFDERTRHYRDNIVVTAVPLG